VSNDLGQIGSRLSLMTIKTEMYITHSEFRQEKYRHLLSRFVAVIYAKAQAVRTKAVRERLLRVIPERFPGPDLRVRGRPILG
jgi:hypothetical protein